MKQQSGSASDSEAAVHNSRLLMTASSPHLAMYGGYQRTVSAPAGVQPSPVGVDPAPHNAAGVQPHLQGCCAGFDVLRPRTISSAYEQCCRARSGLSAATFEMPPHLQQQQPRAPVMVHRAPPGPPPMVQPQRLPGPPPPAGLIRGQRPVQRDEVIYQSVLRTPGSPQQLQQTVNNGTCESAPGKKARLGDDSLSVFDLCSESIWSLYVVAKSDAMS